VSCVCIWASPDEIELTVTSSPAAPQPALIRMDAALLTGDACTRNGHCDVACTAADPPCGKFPPLLLRCVLMEPYTKLIAAASLQLVRSARITNASQAVGPSHAISFCVHAIQFSDFSLLLLLQLQAELVPGKYLNPSCNPSSP
jgi:hypothetical protein